MREILKRVPLLAELTDDDLEQLETMVERVPVAGGELLFEEGSIGDKAYVIEAGMIEILKRSSGREVLLAVRKPGEVIGEMSLLEDSPRMASARARCDSTLLSIDKEHLSHLLEVSASAARAMFYNVLARWRATGAMLKQGEKMAQLGTLTAGIAHELNNPAAAVKRGAAQLQETIARLGAAHRRLGELGLGENPALVGLEQSMQAHVDILVGLDALERSDRESEIEDWLDELGVEDPWDLAAALVELGYDRAGLDGLSNEFEADQLGAVLAWVVATHSAHTLLAEVSQGAGRISEIVKALKTYSYLDQAPVQSVDVHEGLDSTLLILRSKLKQGIKVHREYADEVPRIQAYGSELNQVWTNILDNAAAALGGTGNITIRTIAKGDWVQVEIEDDGPGIPADIQSRVFDAFFTTKPPGEGTGLGLEISYGIIVNRHRGDIKLLSRPGMTRFCISLPVNFEDRDAPPPALGGINRASDSELLEILQSSKVLAVVGLSGDSGRPSHAIPAAAQARGYRVIPVNPRIESALGERAYPDLRAVPDPVDTVIVFRPSDAVPPIVEDAIAIGAKAVWMQEGIINEPAAERARSAGLKVVMDTCWRATMRRLLPAR